MEQFDLNTAALNGITLIEAGAGTGKTFTLAGIFLRLIVENGLGIDQILVVTYTKAATEELKTRIRSRLLTAKEAFKDRRSADDFLASLVDRTVNAVQALQRIEDALSDFDRAAIFTIHGFCQRLLQHYAFETGHLFHSELVQDQQILVQEAADDFWRRHLSVAPYELSHYALSAMKGPEQLADVLERFGRFPELAVVPPPVKPALKAIGPWRRAADEMTRVWTQEKEAILNLMLDPGLNARSYGKCDTDSGQSGLSPRHIRLKALAGAMDRWNGKYPIVDAAQRFSTPFLKNATKKNHDTPRHPFFDICQTAVEAHGKMQDQLAAYLRYLKARFLIDGRRYLDRKKVKRNIMSFDDLLLHVHDALADRRGQALVRSVREQYKAALVDEFQDTDPLQYDIFQKLFTGGSNLLIMIGDPKQAIYSFRGADIFSYLKAAENAQTNGTLTKNWRSTSTLVRAVNTIFENHERPFGFDRIQFKQATAAHIDTDDDQWPLKIWCLTRRDGDGDAKQEKPISQEEALSAIAVAVAEEVVALVSDSSTGVAPSKIAVLTRTHRQSQIIKTALAQKRVPAVLHSAGSVFDTPEAEAMLRVMAAAADPNNPVAVRAALASDLLGVGADEFHAGAINPTKSWQAKWSAFVHDHANWRAHGFYHMLRGLMARENIRSRILTLPDGERRLTNVLHLAELLQQAESDYGLGPEGLIKWLAGRHQASDMGSDEQQLRLENDALAVRILTMHKSKGLQFDVVFCPFTWSGVGDDDASAVYHDSARDDRLSLAIGPDIDPMHRLQSRKEALAENLRMMYVALTRAKKRCYMAWGRINNTEVSAPAYLFHGAGGDASADDWITPLVRKMRMLSDADVLAGLQALSGRSGGSITVEPLPGLSDASYQPTENQTESADCRTVTGTITGNWRIASFSSLTSGAESDDSDWPDHDMTTSMPTGPVFAGESFDNLFGFPKGAAAGLFFHDLIENWAPAVFDFRKHREPVSLKLKSHGFDLRWAKRVGQLLDDLAHTPLRDMQDQFILAQVPAAQRINEMEFYFPLQHTGADTLRQLYGTHCCQVLGRLPAQRLERLTFAPLQGYMKGYIDSVFRFGDKYYLVDWKSNHLGDSYADYSADAIKDTMVRDYYFLQYHLYTTALDQLLRHKIKGYDYRRHFGGVFYIFLRGIGPDRTGKSGIYYDYPDPELVQALGAALVQKGEYA